MGIEDVFSFERNGSAETTNTVVSMYHVIGTDRRYAKVNLVENLEPYALLGRKRT